MESYYNNVIKWKGLKSMAQRQKGVEREYMTMFSSDWDKRPGKDDFQVKERSGDDVPEQELANIATICWIHYTLHTVDDKAPDIIFCILDIENVWIQQTKKHRFYLCSLKTLLKWPNCIFLKV